MSSWLGCAKDAVVSVLVAVSLAMPVAAQDKPLTKVAFSLDFVPVGRHAPWYAAVAEGFFKDEGLEVAIIPSQGTAQSIQADGTIATPRLRSQSFRRSPAETWRLAHQRSGLELEADILEP